MVKVIERFQCDICKECYSTMGEAVKCEKRGIEDKLVSIGDTVEYEVPVTGFPSFFVSLRVKTIESKNHYHIYYFEEYHEESNEWYESDYCMSGIWGNRELINKCKIESR